MENGELRLICFANPQIKILNSQFSIIFKGGVFLHKACGIICEYNPFHNGHKYQIEYAKSTLGLPVVCAMSGNFVQRGTAACMDKSIRAESAIKGGADIVLKIPFPYSSMTAEKFARAGVVILSKSGMCSHLLFGSECADTEKLTRIAKLLTDADADKCIQVYQSNNKNISYAMARSLFVKEKLGEEFADILSNPNDILGVEYIKAIIETGSGLIPVAMKRSVNRREGADGIFASSSRIRELADEGETDTAGTYIPDKGVFAHYRDTSDFYRTLHLSLMAKNPEDLSEICEISDGLEFALVKAARASESYGEMLEKLKSKTVTDAKIRRMALFAFFGVTKEYMTTDVPHTYVLAMSDTSAAKELMRISRKEKEITVAQKIGALKKDEFSEALYNLSRNAERILELSTKTTVFD